MGEGRTKEAVKGILDHCEECEDVGEIQLIQQCMSSASTVHLPFRGGQMGRVYGVLKRAIKKGAKIRVILF